MAGLKPKSSFHDRFIFVGCKGLFGRGHIINLGLKGSNEIMPDPKGE